MELKSASVSRQSSSARRSLLLGLTLAEIMLILLFALLLLLGALGEKVEASRDLVNWGRAIADAFANADMPMASEPPSDFTSFVEKAIVRSGASSARNDDWTRLTTLISNATEDQFALVDELQSANKRLEEEVRINKELQELLNDALQRNKEVEDYTSALENQINELRAGATPPCLYAIANSPQQLHGPSQPIGVLEIRDRILNFREVYAERLEQPLVDFWGDPVDMTDVHSVIGEIEVGKDITLVEFAEIGRRLRAIGEVDNEVHGKCMFTMDWIIEDFVGSNDMFVNVFQAYFLPQRRVVTPRE